ncbi:MAG TPA: thiol reductant ABC exporter subunit CydC [Solirubrobacteraceae bacterium]|nr:thiol reductant ABC exporter subunit CydC [Solirubrobacteraceae bacterium]
MTTVSTPWGSLRTVARLQPGEGRRLWGSIALGFGAVMAAAGLLACSGYLISRAAQRPDILALTAVITAVRAFGLARALLRYGERLVSHDLALRVLSRLRAGFYALLAPLGVAALGTRRQGDLLSRFVADVDTLQDLYLRALAPPVVALMVIIAAGVIAFVMLPIAGLVIVAALLITALVVPALTAAVVASASRRQAAARAALTDALVDSLEGSVELAVAGRAHERVEWIRGLSDNLTRIARRDALAAAGATTLSALMTGMTVVVVLLVAIPAVHSHSLSPVLLAAVAMLVLAVFEGLAPLPVAARTLRGCAESARRLTAMAEITPTVSNPLRPRLLSDRQPELKLDQVSFAYGPDPILRDLTVSFEPGCRVALTGSSGAGKTTLAHLLVRFADPTTGRITLGDTDLKDLELHDVRRLIVLAAQDAHVFTTTVRENLLLANREATEEQLWGALATVQLDRFVRQLPDGIDTLVGEDGDLLSGGERQRLTLARALISDAAFLILDEPTAHLDDTTAAALMHAIDRAAGGRGLIVISHRADDLVGFDTTLNLSDGTLAQRA